MSLLFPSLRQRVLAAIETQNLSELTTLTPTPPWSELDPEESVRIECTALIAGNPEVLNYLRAQGLPHTPNSYAVLETHFNPVAYQDFCDHRHHLPNNGNDLARQLTNNCLKNMIHADPAVRHTARHTRTRLIQDFDVSSVFTNPVVALSSWSTSVFHHLLSVDPTLDAEDHTFIENLPPNFQQLFANALTNANHWSFESFARAQGFLRIFPTVAHHCQQHALQTQEHHIKWKQFWRELIPVGAPTWCSTHVAAYMDETEKHTQDNVFLSNQTHRVRKTHLEKVEMFFINPEWDQKMGFDVHDRLARFGPWVKLETGGAYGMPFSALSPPYTPVHWTVTALLSAPTVLEHFLEEHHSHAWINQILEDKHNLLKWSIITPIDTINKLCATLPQWTTWTDENGNSLAHYVLATSSLRLITENMVEKLAAVNPTWTTHRNHSGVGLTDLLVARNAPQEVVAQMQRCALAHSITTDPVTPTPRARKL